MVFSVRSQQSALPQVGAAYRRHSWGALVETANVLQVGPDRMGIPHVRFELQVKRGNGMPTVETRTLSLEAFQNRYRELVQSGPNAVSAGKP